MRRSLGKKPDSPVILTRFELPPPCLSSCGRRRRIRSGNIWRVMVVVPALIVFKASSVAVNRSGARRSRAPRRSGGDGDPDLLRRATSVSSPMRAGDLARSLPAGSNAHGQE
ncbi:hypothetical protein Franean1_3200 [Parafrankia sp. EAN1pec]|nr:hypothetical protein Franean1_3200 [Frankia sp. EAN1pec]